MILKLCIDKRSRISYLKNHLASLGCGEAARNTTDTVSSSQLYRQSTGGRTPGGVILAGVSEFSKGLSPKSGPRNAAQLRVGQVLKAL